MKRNKTLEFVSDPTKNFLTFFIVSILLFTLIADGVSLLFWEVFGDWLQTRSGIEKGWLRAGVIFTLVALLLLLIYATDFSRWIRRWLVKLAPLGVRQPERVGVAELTARFPGLIVVMSLKLDSPAEVAIRHHWNGNHSGLKHCWIICTEKSLPFAQEMEKRFIDEGMTQFVEFYYGNYILEDIESEKPEQQLSLLVPDALLDDPDYIRKLVNCIYADAERKGLNEADIIADYTGGTKGTTAGILLACAVPERELQYISQVQSPALQAINISYKIRPVR